MIDSWEALSTCTSKTHTLEISLHEESGWIRSRIGDEDYYLTTHTFYPSQVKSSEALLRLCGFDVTLKKDN